ncbi:MAG: hypothetical protein EOO62_29810, partial [Hymenobacter sp.]
MAWELARPVRLWPLSGGGPTTLLLPCVSSTFFFLMQKPTAAPILEVRDVRKQYAAHTALDG